ncbi:acetyltransferase [Falsibacillus albus]|uniref:Acetyltransferase n=1 Tax=Falsibacillus albus TaxID=2478915 RepID=A0A3L7JZX6_9BACI|nr:acetyltransferase [Falsibacillus albus]RLQ96347.1 acetyltransferase [Falsibacillus albus]
MNIAVIGAGGHSRVIQELIGINGFQLIGLFDDKFEDDHYFQNLYTGPISSTKKIKVKFSEVKFIIAIGDNRNRKLIFERLQLDEDDYISLIHPSAIVSRSAKIGNGTVIMPRSVINAEARIGAHVIINTSSIIEHDTMLDSFVHISPNAVLTGGVKVREGAHVGASATFIPCTNAGEWSTIGAGAVVNQDIPPYHTAVGIPAKVIKNIGRNIPC